MALSHEQLDDIILRSPDHFVLEKDGEDGTRHVYRGRDLVAFKQRADAKQHEHKVYDKSGNLIYHRLSSGQIVLGAHAGELEKWERKRKAGQAALTGLGIFRESLRKAIAFNARNLRGGR